MTNRTVIAATVVISFLTLASFYYSLYTSNYCNMNLPKTWTRETILKRDASEWEKQEAKRFQNTRRKQEYRQNHETETTRETRKKRNRERDRKRRTEAAAARAAAQKSRQEMLLAPNLVYRTSQHHHDDTRSFVPGTVQ